MLKLARTYWLVLSLICIVFTNAEATHLRAGDITVVRKSCSSYCYTITLHVYTRANVPVKFSSGSSGELNFGDGSKIFHPHEVDNPPIIGQSDNGPIGEVTYSVDYCYAGPGLYTITYYEQNRNDGVLNIANSVETPFFIQTQLLIDDFVGGCNNSPQLLVPPIDQGCTGVKWTHNPGAWDPDGDSLSYSLYVPKQGGVYNTDGLFVSGIDVGGYNDPNSQQYYSSNGIPYSKANEQGNGPPIFKIDPLSGTITWDSPGRAGEYNIAFIIREWRRIPGTATWVSLGYVERDMQIVIQDCKNDRPKLTVPPDVCVVAGTKVTADIFAVDPAVVAGARTKQDGDSTRIEGFSDVFNTVAPLATITPGPKVWQVTISDTQQAHVQFNWQTTCAHVKEQPYEVVFKATDNGAPPLASFESWKIRVVAPAPIWNSAVLNPNQRSATLTWQPYTCSNAVTMQVWRKVGSTSFAPPQCVTGMPDYLGYTLINSVPINKTSYVDQNLAIGAAYCYRLVAVFPSAGGESYVSEERCLPPIDAVAPVITNVTIDVTDPTAGKVTVKWRPPFDLNQAQFPPPYTYVVKRADGVSGNINLKDAHPGQLSDTTFVDTGLNTANNVYNYRVVLHNSSGVIDTSAVASTVRLELKPLSTEIELTWNAVVPWSNIDPDIPRHLIYRSTNTGSKQISDLVLIDSVDVGQHVFSYIDSGKFDHTPLVKTQDYCYAVMTRGTYGNPKIKSPLKNFSEITCINLTASEPPCKPSFPVTLTGIDCNNFNSCPVPGSTYSNTIHWMRPSDVNCQKDIKGYNIYYANSIGDTFTLLNTQVVTDTFYVDSGLSSFARCYKVSAVNRAGVESELSDQFCFDNCPYYELPNVFTPNGDGCNDKFSAYNVRYYTDKGWPCGSNPEVPKDSIHYANIKSKCARFVLAVAFTVYNRWGREVYKYQGRSDDDVSTIYIDWDGKDSQGRDLDPGVYYYSAAVVYDVVDPKKRNGTIKGWVQLIR